MKDIFWRIASCIGACVVLTSCGAILEEAAEQALEQGGVELELDDLEDGEFTVNIENEDGEDATIEVDGNEGVVQFETEEGEGEFTFDGALAEDWPDEFALPDDAVVLTSFSAQEAEQSIFNASFSGPSGSLDSYLEHFRGFSAPVLSESEFSVDGGQNYTITWGTDEESIGLVNLGDVDGELLGQISVQLPN